jgi:hypothetical protein
LLCSLDVWKEFVRVRGRAQDRDQVSAYRPIAYPKSKNYDLFTFFCEEMHAAGAATTKRYSIAPHRGSSFGFGV